MALRKKNKRKRATKQQANNAEMMRRRILKVIRQQGEPMPVGKLPEKLAKKYGSSFPKIPQVFRCNPLVLLEQQMSSAVKVSMHGNQYYVSAIKNGRLAKGPKKLKRPPQIKERAGNMFVEDLPKDQTFTQQSNALKTIVKLVRDAESDWVQLSTLSQLYKTKTGVDLRCKNLFGCTLPKLIQNELAHKLFSEKRCSSGELWVTYIPDPQEAEESDHESEVESDTEEELEQLRAQMEKMGFPKPLVKPEFDYFDLKPPGQALTKSDSISDQGGETLEKEVKECLDWVLELLSGPMETCDESQGEEDAYGSEGFWD